MKAFQMMHIFGSILFCIQYCGGRLCDFQVRAQRNLVFPSLSHLRPLFGHPLQSAGSTSSWCPQHPRSDPSARPKEVFLYKISLSSTLRSIHARSRPVCCISRLACSAARPYGSSMDHPTRLPTPHPSTDLPGPLTPRHLYSPLHAPRRGPCRGTCVRYV